MRLLIIEDDRDAADYLVKAFSMKSAISPTPPMTAKTVWPWRRTANMTC